MTEAEAKVLPFRSTPGMSHLVLASLGRVESALRKLGRRWLRGESIESPLLPMPASPVREVADRPPIVFLPAVSWTYRFQRPQQLARALAGAGSPILYVDVFSRRYVQPESWLERVGTAVWRLEIRVPGRPDPYRWIPEGAMADHLAHVVQQACVLRPGMILVQLPFWGSVGEVLRKHLGAPLIYDRIDLHTDFPGVPKAVGRAEIRLLERADLVLTSSRDLMRRSREHAGRVEMLPNAVALEDFVLRTSKADRPRIGYVGALSSWFDVDAVRRLAEGRREWDVVLAGRVEDPTVAALAKLPNVRLLGEIPYRQVPGFLADLDVALIPFRDQPLTRAVDPVKLYEALATGLPVVARDLPELNRFATPWVYRYREPAELPSTVDRALLEDHPGLACSRRSRVQQETWRERAETLLDFVDSLPGHQISEEAEIS